MPVIMSLPKTQHTTHVSSKNKNKVGGFIVIMEVHSQRTLITFSNSARRKPLEHNWFIEAIFGPRLNLISENYVHARDEFMLRE